MSLSGMDQENRRLGLRWFEPDMTFRVISQDIEDTLTLRRVRVFLVQGQVAADANVYLLRSATADRRVSLRR